MYRRHRLAVIASALLAVGGARSVATAAIPPDAPRGKLPAILTIAGAAERGTRLVVTGRVVSSATNRPIANALIGVYHTDASGEYGKDPHRSAWARLNGWLRTDSLGRYEVRTIRPGPYPGGGTPAHIHFRVSGESIPERAFELRFEDDPLVTSTERDRSRLLGAYGSVRPVLRDHAGVQRVVRDFRTQ